MRSNGLDNRRVDIDSLLHLLQYVHIARIDIESNINLK